MTGNANVKHPDREKRIFSMFSKAADIEVARSILSGITHRIFG